MDITQIVFIVAGLFGVVALILLLAWVSRRFLGGGRPSRQQSGSPLRRRERRLHLVEAASISPRHKLVLVRRDEAEHLLLIGGATELVVESRIPAALGAAADTRTREPSFEPSPSPGYAPQPSGPELPRGSGFGTSRYGAATPAAGYASDSYDRPEQDDVGFRNEPASYGRQSDETESYGRSEQDSQEEPDYFASVRTTEERISTSGYLDRLGRPAEDQPSPSPYETYRPTYPSAEGEGETYPDRDRRAEDEEAPEADTPQARILSRFLRKEGGE